jgi:plasmid stabilization system protein ParE
LKRSYRLTRRAIRDLETIQDYYNQSSIRVGNRFIDAVYAAVEVARERPTSFPEVEAGIRTVRCKKFPYKVYFELLPDDSIMVGAIYHGARDPRRWNDPTRQ